MIVSSGLVPVELDDDAPTHCYLCGTAFGRFARQDPHDPKNCTACLRERQRDTVPMSRK